MKGSQMIISSLIIGISVIVSTTLYSITNRYYISNNDYKLDKITGKISKIEPNIVGGYQAKYEYKELPVN